MDFDGYVHKFEIGNTLVVSTARNITGPYQIAEIIEHFSDTWFYRSLTVDGEYYILVFEMER